MNSKGIQPRVGMQVRRNGGRSEVISSIGNMIELSIGGVSSGSCLLPTDPDATSWPEGRFEIEWVPPTDEERKMFMDAAYCVTGYPTEFDRWYMSEAPHLGAREIAESLAMDGL